MLQETSQSHRIDNNKHACSWSYAISGYVFFVEHSNSLLAVGRPLRGTLPQGAGFTIAQERYSHDRRTSIQL